MIERIQRGMLHMIDATMWSTRSMCQRYSVGCVITDESMKRTLSRGYNGPARGLPNESCRGTVGACGCLHAEMNAVALVDSTIPLKVAFVTVAPCELCAQLLMQANVYTVFYLRDYRDNAGIELLKSSRGMFIKQIKEEDLNEALRWITNYPSLKERSSSSTAKPQD